MEAHGRRIDEPCIVHPNLHLRGQAMEALSALTNEELFPWRGRHVPLTPSG